MRTYCKLLIQVVVIISLLGINKIYAQKFPDIDPKIGSGPCLLTVPPDNINFGSAAGTRAILVTTADRCILTVTDDKSWITASYSSLQNAINISVTANTGNERTGTVTVENFQIQITQSEVCPTVYSVTGGGSYCSGGVGIYVGLSNSQSGVTYTLKRGSTTVKSLSGTGSALNFGIQTIAGTYTVVAKHNTTNCTKTMSGSATVTVNSLPARYSVTGGGQYCYGDDGKAVGLSDSQSGVVYSLIRNGTATVKTKTGTGSAISFGNQTSGTYTVSAERTSTGCTRMMSGSVTVSRITVSSYSVTGGGQYCPGDDGVTVGLSDSQSGASYMLLVNNAIANSDPVEGNGSAISFGKQTATGTYTVVANKSGCIENMNGSKTVSTYPKPTKYNVTGGGTICESELGLIIGLSDSQSGYTYQLLGGSSIKATKTGDGSAISFAPQNTVGTYTVKAISPNGCEEMMTGNATINVIPKPEKFDLTNGGSFCSGESGILVKLLGSEAGNDYHLKRDGVTVQTVTSQTGTTINFGYQTEPGDYKVLATNSLPGCSSYMNNTATIIRNELPEAYSVTGGGSYCIGGDGVNIKLSDSQTGISYQLKRNGVNVSGALISGTGSLLNFGKQTSTGTYTVVATNNTTGCTNAMNGSTTVTVNSLPTQYTVTGGGQYCDGDAGKDVGLSDSQSGVVYSLIKNGTTTVTTKTGTGSAISFGDQPVGTYTVNAERTATGCTRMMSGSVTTSKIIVSNYSVTGGGQYCPGDDGVTVGLSDSESGASYMLLVNNAIANSDPVEGTGSSISFGKQTATGTYTVVANKSGCIENMNGSKTVSTYPKPTKYNVTGGGTICESELGLIIGLSDSQSGYTYQLLGGSSVKATKTGDGSAISFAPQHTGGTYAVKAISSNGCEEMMTGNATINVIPKPEIFNLGDGGSFCSDGTGIRITLDGSEHGTTYFLKRDGSNVASADGTLGHPIDFGYQTEPGNYTVLATNSIPGCISTMNGTATVIRNETPEVFEVTGGGTVCSSTGGVEVGLDGSENNVTYYLKNAAGDPIDQLPGDGAAISFGKQNVSDTFTVYAEDETGNCTANMTGQADVTIKPSPLKYNITSSGKYCPGENTAPIELDGSEDDVIYEITKSHFTSTILGTGSSMSLGSFNDGAYKIEAQRDGCSTIIDNWFEISEKAIAAPTQIFGESDVCVGDEFTYHIDPVSGAVGYEWIPGSNVEIISGQGTESVTVSILDQSLMPTIAVKAIHEDCASNATQLALNVNIAPGLPPVINGEQLALAGSTHNYSIVFVSKDNEIIPKPDYIDHFEWVGPSDANIITELDGMSAIIMFGEKSGPISVWGVNDCGPGAAREMDVSVYTIPDAPEISETTNSNSVNISIQNPNPDYNYYWQETQSGTSTEVSGTSNTYTESGIYYVRARLKSEPYAWGDALEFVVYVKPPVPPQPIFKYDPGLTTVMYNIPFTDSELFWQTAPDGTSTLFKMDHPGGPYAPGEPVPLEIATEFTESETLYLRARLNDNHEIWSDALQVSIEVHDIEGVSVSDVYLGGGEELQIITVNAECNWEITDKRASWFSVSPLSGNTTQDITILTEINSGDYRSGSFKVGDFTVHVNQFNANESGETKNWIESVVYDGSRNPVAHGKTYYDLMGKPVQSQSKNISSNTVVINQTLYDALGRAVVSSLPAAVKKTELNYHVGFITDQTNQIYKYNHFDDAKLTTPDPVGNTLTGSLGWYYSNNNILEAHVPATPYPYTRVEYSKTTGQARRSTLAGEQHVMGSGHETMSFTMPASDQELLSIKNTMGINLETTGLTKTISVDAEDKISVTYTNSDGNVIATCLGTGGTENQINHIIPKELGYVDVYLSSAVSLPGGYTYTITNLENDQSASLGKGFYRIAVNEALTADLTIPIKIANSHYALNVYDKAGRLVESYSPKAVANSDNTLKTTYTYNVFGWLIETSSPDEGTTRYVYRKDGSIRFSQNSEQRRSGNEFSYTNYDAAGRVIEVGEHESSIGFDLGMNPELELNDSYSYQTTHTMYDIPDPNFNVDGYTQNFVAGNVSKTWNNNVTTWYSYTYDGKIDWIAQELAVMDNALVTIDYEYDFNGNVTRVIYQKDQPNQFDHRYEYDADLRLERVYTTDYSSGEGEVKQAEYFYYAHGPLKRVEIAENLQGIDYVYTVNGWLKSINDPSLLAENDPGGDSNDLFGMALDYYSGDYERNNNIKSINTGNNLYDGNIAAQRWQTQTENSNMNPGAGKQWMSTYTYNSRNYLQHADFGKFNYTNNTAETPIVQNLVNLTYDANGNIDELKRYSVENGMFDNFQYSYDNGNNQLTSLYDNAGTVQVNNEDYTGLEHGEHAFNYNAIGQMTMRNNTGQQDYYKYNVYGKVTGIYEDNAGSLPIVEYLYDDKGFRVKKTDFVQNTETWYVRDASGNILSVYTSDDGVTIQQRELPIYGSGRMGTMYKTDSQYEYELTDHLGNVRATFSRDTDDNLQLNSYADYYPGGMIMPGRHFVSEQYRHDYQGQYAEHDQETGYHAFELRLYDSRINRFTSPDPYNQYWSSYVAMGNNWPNMIDPDGGWVKGAGFFRNVFMSDYKIAQKATANFDDPLTPMAVPDFEIYTYNMREGSIGEILANDAGLFKRMIGKYGGTEFGQSLWNARQIYSVNNCGATKFMEAVMLTVATLPMGGIGGANSINGLTSVAFRAPRVFYAGEGMGSVALKFANQNGMRLLNRKDITMLYKISPRLGEKAAINASRNYAKFGIGDAHVFLNSNSGVRINSVWGKIEYPALKANGINIIFHP